MEVGWAGSAPHFIYYTIHHIQHQHIFCFPPSLALQLASMLSAARFAAVGMVSRPSTHVVRDAFCEGDEGIARGLGTARVPSHSFCCKGVQR